MSTRLLPLLLFAAAAALAGCGREPVPACTPFEEAYVQNVHPILEEKCGACHGSEPQYGAPYSLVEGYADLVAGEEGARKVDGVLASVLAGRMPEGSAEPLTHNELDTLVGWASCGLEHPEGAEGLTVNREVWEAGDVPPEGAVAVELTAINEAVGVNDIDDYRTFSFSGVVAGPRFIQRIEPIVDEDRVLHHITLTREGGTPYLYAWAPGTGAIQLPDGGIRIEPSDAFEVEIHYNNGAGVPDAVDSSGVRLWVGPTEGTEYAMMSPVSWDIYVPANGRGTAIQDCTVSTDFEVLAGMPHMHEVGSSFSHDLIRADGSVENLITLSGWSFESQYFYEMPAQVRAGDRLRLQCGYDNPNDRAVTAGLGTSDEMCFNFMVVTPPEAAFECGD